MHKKIKKESANLQFATMEQIRIRLHLKIQEYRLIL